MVRVIICRFGNFFNNLTTKIYKFLGFSEHKQSEDNILILFFGAFFAFAFPIFNQLFITEIIGFSDLLIGFRPVYGVVCVNMSYGVFNLRKILGTVVFGISFGSLTPSPSIRIFTVGWLAFLAKISESIISTQASFRTSILAL